MQHSDSPEGKKSKTNSFLPRQCQLSKLRLKFKIKMIDFKQPVSTGDMTTMTTSILLFSLCAQDQEAPISFSTLVLSFLYPYSLFDEDLWTLSIPYSLFLLKVLITTQKTGSFLDHFLRIGTTKQTGLMEDINNLAAYLLFTGWHTMNP